jgi:glutaconyl-CoA/methylmalonyl-CoA decarboxylase subunit gamma
MAKHLNITVEGKVYDVIVEDVTEDAGSSLYPQPGLTAASVPGAAAPAAPAAPASAAKPAAASAGAKDKVAPMGGVIVEISVAVGDQVKAGQQVAVIEAMKMKTVVAADHDGKVTKIMVKAGDAVDSDQPLMTIE